MSKTAKSLYCGTIGMILFVTLRNYVSVRNMVFFVIMCMVFTATALGTYLVLNKKNDLENNISCRKWWEVLFVFSLIVWMVLFFVNETKAEQSLDKDALIRSYFPFPIWFGITLAGTLICVWILNKKPITGSGRINGVVRGIVSLLFTIGTSVQFYAPNVFLDLQGGTFHSHAYTNSIINVCWLVPYSKDMQAMYGHYAIFYMPFVKALHSLLDMDYLTGLFIVTAVVAGISILLYLWVLNYFAKHDLIYYLGMFAIGEYYFMLMQGGVYLQVHPHRMIFPILLLAFVLLEYKKEREYKIISIVILTLSLVWSTEVGLVMMLAFALYRWVVHIMDGCGLSVKKCLLAGKELVLYFVIPFAAGYGVVNAYNVILAKGAAIDLREFLYPLISDRGYVGTVELPLPGVTHSWIGASVLFLVPIGLVMLSVLFAKKNQDTKWQPFYFLIGIMSLGLMLYYINRPAMGSMFIILFLMLILQAVILQKSQNIYIEWKENKEDVFHKEYRFFFLSLRIITTVILFVMAFDCVYSMPKAWKTSVETVWKRQELQEFMDYIYVQVPTDAVYFGEPVPEMLSMIDRDTHLHTTEWSITNMPIDTMERIRYALEGEKWIFCNLYSLWTMQEEYPGLTDGYELNEIFEYGGHQFGFFLKIE